MTTPSHQTKKIADAAQQWGVTWQNAWPRGDWEAIAALYAPSAVYRAVPFREPDRGLPAIRSYLQANADAEHNVVCRFGDPVVGDARAAIEWWASWTENEEQLTMAGITVLLFNESGLVIDHRDYWNQTDGDVAPYDGWD